MGEWIAGVLQDAAAYVRDGIWNSAAAIYGFVMLVWELFGRAAGLQSKPTDHVWGAAFLAVVFGSAGAYRKARVKSRWDRSALRVITCDPVTIDERTGERCFRLVLQARTSIPQPTRMRIWWNQKPETQSVKLAVRDHRGTGSPAFKHLGKDFCGTIKTRGRRTDIEFPVPAIDDDKTDLMILVQGPPTLQYKAIAAYRPMS